MGGQPYELRTLTLDESDEWLGKVAAAMSAIEIPDEVSWLGDIAALLTTSATAVAGLVAEYDRDGVLGGLDVIRARMTKRELKAAMDAMVTAEDPFGTDVARSVATGFGAPSQTLAFGIERVAVASQLAISMNGRSARSGSTIDGSAASGAASSSSSAGPTPTSVSAASRRSA
jgi:hypothetical protein